MMADVESGAIPVVDSDRIVGLVTDRDLVLRALAEALPLTTPVSDVMTCDVETCRQDDNVADAAGKMGARQIRRLRVLGPDGHLAGMLSLGDVALEYGAKQVGHTLGEISENTPAAH